MEEGLIMRCKIYRDANNVVIDYMLTSHTRGSVILDKLYILGFLEWKYIAQFIKRMSDKELREAVRVGGYLRMGYAGDVTKSQFTKTYLYGQ